MSRRRQFSLRLIFAITALVALACAVWINLPIAVRVAIGTAAASFFFWLLTPTDFGKSDLIVWIARDRSPPTYVIKRRGGQSDKADPKRES